MYDVSLKKGSQYGILIEIMILTSCLGENLSAIYQIIFL
jgi:hypothetical protein